MWTQSSPTALTALIATTFLVGTTNARALQVSDINNVLSARQDASNHWIDTWTSMPQLVESSNMPPSQFSSGGVLKDATLRQTLHLSVGAPKIKITISNTFGGSDLPITAVTVGLPEGGKAGVSGIGADPIVPVTFGGSASATVKKGEVLTSDEVAFEVKPQSMITVSLYSQAGQSGSSITGHPGSRTTSWFGKGNQVNSTTFSGGASAAHWYFVSAVQAYVPKETNSLIILGDSITDGRGSTDNANNRWPDLVLARLQSSNHSNIAVCNQAAGGNTVLSGGLGPPLLTRYNRDAITQPGVKYVMIFEGVNDIGGAADSASTQSTIGDNLIKAFTQIASDAKKAGLITIGATITPFCAPSASQQSYTGKNREAARQKVNKWILTSGTFDHTVDFSAAVSSKTASDELDSKYNGGDYLHPNAAGYQEMANSFPLDIFN